MKNNSFSLFLPKKNTLYNKKITFPPISLQALMPVKTLIPTYFEYSVMSDYGYLEADDAGKQSLRSKLDEGWEVQECPNGQLDSGYVGTVFVHEARKQIVVAHAGTLPSRIKTFLADARGVVGAGADPLLLDALMRSQGKGQVTLKKLVEEEGYRLSFTGHSLGGFLAEMSVYACHRGFGLYYPEASAVVFDSPGSLEVMQAWESHIAQHQIKLQQLNIVSFLSSPNLVNTVNSHLGTVYRLIRDIRVSTFEFYLVASHDRKALFALFDPVTGYPREECWVEMEDWPLADYEELLSLKDHPISQSLDLAAKTTVGFVSGLAQNIYGFLSRSPSKVSPTRLFGGKEPKKLWELLNSKEPKNYHLLFDTATQEGLQHALETHYIIKSNAPPVPLMQRLPCVNIPPEMLAFLMFHEGLQENPLYQHYLGVLANSGIVFSLPHYQVDKGYLYLVADNNPTTYDVLGGSRCILHVLGMLEILRHQHGREFLKTWAQQYTDYVGKVIVKVVKQGQEDRKLAGGAQQTSNKALLYLQAELANSNSCLKKAEGWTPLLVAIYRGDLDEVKRITTDNPASIKDRDRLGNNACLLAATYGRSEIFRWLTENPDNLDLDQEELSLDIKNSEGQTPFLAAVYGGQKGFIAYLLGEYPEKSGEFLTETDRLGKNAISIADFYNRKEVYDHLNSLGKNVNFSSIRCKL